MNGNLKTNANVSENGNVKADANASTNVNMNAKQWKCGIVIVCLGILFLLIFSYSSSPLFPYFYGWDSAFFQWVGAGMTKGYLPYRDYFDMKGPWLFLLEYVGQLLCYGRVGNFLLQAVNLSVFLLILWRLIGKQKGDWKDALLVFVPIFLILSSAIEGGGNTEELSLAALMAAFACFLSWERTEEEEHPARYAFVYGVCFGILALIRITNAALLCAMVATAVIVLILHGKWKNLLWNALAFLGGVAAAFLIPLCYFGYYGEIKEMLYCTFVFGFVYGTEGFGYGAGKYFLPLALFPLFVEIMTGQKNKKAWIFSGLWGFGMIIVLGMGNSSMHDYTMLVPGVAFGMLEYAAYRKKGEKNVAKERLLVAGTILLLLFPCYKMLRTVETVVSLPGDRQLYEDTKDIIAQIPEEELDSVYGYVVPLRFYWINDLAPYSKYCGWQEHYMDLVPAIEAEMEEMMQRNPPEWFVCKASGENRNEMILSYLERDYEPVKENGAYRLYRRRE